MIAETILLATIAIVIAAAAFIVKLLDFENETAFKALNLLAAIIFSVIFFLESATIAMYAAILWAIIALLSFLFGQRNESPLRGWNEELWPSNSKPKPKRKRKPKEEKPEDGTASGGESTPIWPWG